MALGLLLFVGSGTLGGCKTAAPPVLGEVPTFQLVSESGEPFDSSSLKGRPWLASFLFTSCPGPCPRLVEKLKSVRSTIPASQLAFVSISVDPENDTPSVLTQYKTARGILEGDGWTFLTGSTETVMNLVRKGFLTGVEKSENPTAEGSVTHGVRVVLVDGERRIRGFYATDRDEDMSRLRTDVGAL